MRNSILCFWLEPTDQVELSLRRYRSSARGKCVVSGLGYHDASVIVERVSVKQLADRGWPIGENGRPMYVSDGVSRSSPRWPISCSCGYRFAERDEWQSNQAPLFRRSDTGELVTLAAAPAGAMWNAEWMGDGCRGPDGVCLCVRTPGGEWPVDGPSYQEGQIRHARGWTRTGAIPEVTVSPSIVIPGKYQGVLRDGWLQAL